jgi:hypothetical protein
MIVPSAPLRFVIAATAGPPVCTSSWLQLSRFSTVNDWPS